MSTAANTIARAEEVIARCKLLATFSEDAGSTRRTFLSPPMRDCHREITKWLAATGAGVTVDAAGNLRALYPASESKAPRLLLGSHLDTVPNAGAYDGVLGVVLVFSGRVDAGNLRNPILAQDTRRVAIPRGQRPHLGAIQT